MKRTLALIVIAIGIAAVACSRSAAPVRASNPQLVYICGQAPCVNDQEFEVSDGNGAPIFSVGEYGGPAVFGDNLKVFPPGTVYHPALTFSYASPAVYDETFGLPDKCVPPSKWIAPQGTWLCRAGWWHRVGA